MKNTIRSLFLIATFAGSVAHAAQAPTPPPTTTSPAPAVTKCEDLVKRFSDLYTTLYNVDTRPLAIDSYRSYRDSIQLLHDDTLTLSDMCSGSNVVTSPQTLYKSRDLKWTSGTSFDSPCASADFSTVQAEFQETSIRECYRDSYNECAVKSQVRVYAITGTRNNDATWACAAKMDLVLSAKH